MKKKLIKLIACLGAFCGVCMFSFSSSNPLLHLGIIESLTGGDRLEDILIPDSKILYQTVEVNNYSAKIERTSNFNYAGVSYSIPFTTHGWAQVKCCGRMGEGYDLCRVWSSDTSKEQCPYYYRTEYKWAAWWD